tara:strand:- start:41 stop:154 length:114 start_codon:yes stop_codon:yes gene_type:complete
MVVKVLRVEMKRLIPKLEEEGLGELHGVAGTGDVFIS